MDKRLSQLADCGQSIWLDYIRRDMFASGELRRLVDLGLRGMTSNPTIFEKAIGAGNDYDEQLRALVEHGDGRPLDANDLFEALAIDDIRHAADIFREVYDRTGDTDGFVSLEVSPLLAHDTDGTIAAAKRLWATVDRPNIMIKIPGTRAGIPAITEATAAGINVNVTLIFSLEAYEAATRAYIAGLQRRADRGEPINRIASVNSVFVSRIDTAIDKQLQERISHGEQPLSGLLGKTGLANLKLIYQRFKAIFKEPAFEKLRALGAHVQRPLWASTGTKNPAYSDLLYVENVVARDTVNTVPPATLDALLDHLTVRPNGIEEHLDEAVATLEQLAQARISLFDVTQKLQEDGVKLFADSYNALLAAVTYKADELKQHRTRVSIDLGRADANLDATLRSLTERHFLRKLWEHDPSVWSNDAQHASIIQHALGWLDFPHELLARVDDLQSFARECAKEFAHVVVLGMGGSSLAPDILRETFGKIADFPQLHVLDSSDPAQVRSLENELDLTRTLFVVASKSGTTIEPDAFMRYFFGAVQRNVGESNAGRHFIAITDPGTALVDQAKQHNFRRVFLNDPDIGGRYSALSCFGMVPAALAGYDVRLLLDRGIGVLHANARTTPEDRADGVRFGAAIGALAKHGRDKLTIVCHPKVAAFGAWCEQLVAESTGKSGLAIVPVEGEALGHPHEYGNDRVFVYVGERLPGDAHIAGHMDASTIVTRLNELAAAGHPVVRLAMNDAYDIGEQFALWEIATAAAGAVLGIDPFDQPNVQESKDNTKRLLAEYAQRGNLSEPKTALSTSVGNVVPLSGSARLSLGAELRTALGAVLGQVKPGDYIAITAYLEMSHEHQVALNEIRLKLRNALRVATTVGFGPRFLHSTGQMHKGGPASGVFLQLTTDALEDVPVPGMVSFKVLERAQALGDFESLDTRERRGLRLHLSQPLDVSLEALSTAVDDAVAAKA